MLAKECNKNFNYHDLTAGCHGNCSWQSRLGAVFFSYNVLLSMEIHDKQLLFLNLSRSCHKCYSYLA